MDLPVRFADFQCGTRCPEARQIKRPGFKSLTPDLVITSTGEGHEIRAVSEVKTVWTFNKSKGPRMVEFLAVKFTWLSGLKYLATLV
jgi:hypothetical protein